MVWNLLIQYSALSFLDLVFESLLEMYFHLWISAEERRFFKMMMSSSVKPEMSSEGSAGTYTSGDISDCLFVADREGEAKAGAGAIAGAVLEGLAGPVCFCNRDILFGLATLPRTRELVEEPTENVVEHAEEGADTGVEIAEDEREERDEEGATKDWSLSLSLSWSWSWCLSGSSCFMLGGRGWNAGLRTGKTVVLPRGGVVAVELKDDFALL